MEAFKNWWDKIKYLHNPYHVYDHKRGWRAALEWVLHELSHQYEEDAESLDIYKDIEKELER